jgi:SH3 domain-containing YSC84-like protein 1
MVPCRKTLVVLLMFGLFGLIQLSFTAVSCRADVQGDVDRAVIILERFYEIPENSIPPAVLRHAHGLVILRDIKAGFILSGRGGSGIVVARTSKGGWSGPSAISTGGAGFGFQAGGEVTEFVLVLNSRAAVEAFSQGGNVSLGGQLSAAAGPVGRTAEGSVLPVAAVYTYSRSQGLFAGASLEGTVIVTRDERNEDYYRKPVSPAQILSGAVRPPKGAQRLLKVLSRY